MEILKILGYSIVTLGLLFTSELIRKSGKTQPEFTRKLSHISAGLLGVSFFFIYSEWWAVLVYTGVFSVLLTVAYYYKHLNSIHGVERKTWGAQLFPISVGLCFTAQSILKVPEIYCPAILTLTFADPAASIIGSRWPVFKYKLWKSNKSIGGSASFFLVALLVSSIFNMFFTQQPISLDVLIIACITATFMEAAIGWGFDNFVVPASYILVYFLIK
ncbi:MAG: diacylglycerol/polyprenol kinase family protein [Flexibacteraceae bacterium]